MSGAGAGPADGVADGAAGDAGVLAAAAPAAITTEIGATRTKPVMRIRRTIEQTSGQRGLGGL